MCSSFCIVFHSRYLEFIQLSFWPMDVSYKRSYKHFLLTWVPSLLKLLSLTKCQRVHGSDTASFPLKPCGHLHSAHSGQIHSNLQWHHQQFLWAGRSNLMSQSCLLLADYCAVKQTSLHLLIICISFCELPTYVLCPFKIYVHLSFALLHFMGLYILSIIQVASIFSLTDTCLLISVTMDFILLKF